MRIPFCSVLKAFGCSPKSSAGFFRTSKSTVSLDIPESSMEVMHMRIPSMGRGIPTWPRSVLTKLRCGIIFTNEANSDSGILSNMGNPVPFPQRQGR